MSLVNAEVIRSTKSAVVRRQFYFIAYNDLQIHAVSVESGWQNSVYVLLCPRRESLFY